LASGNLKARADEGNGKSRGNEVAALLRDFNQMAERIESLVGAQRQLIRDVSHELRSPLARLSVALELMREETNSESRLHLDRMEREAERLNRLIGQLLELSRIETMAAPPKNEPVLLEEIVEKVVADAAYEASSRGCGVRALIRDNIMVKGDPELLSSAIENIVRNGIRYTRDETEVLVTLERDQTSVSAVVTVRDFGPGVPEDKLESLCLPFYRVDAARGLDTGGAGVGLAIAERVLRIHGGSLSLANHPDGGLVAAISLPASTVLSSPASLTAQSALA
jgi:two-component system sensor histidine kinase CpxA